MDFSTGLMVGAWLSVLLAWVLARRIRRTAARHVVPLHKTYDLEPISDTAVTVVCADPLCRKPLGVANIAGWGYIAEQHYREEVANRG